jgi:hypothetical protein
MSAAVVAVDEAMVREFIEIISRHAVSLANGAGKPGFLQLTRLSPLDENLVPSRFRLDDADGMIKTAISDASAGHNVYLEGRTVREDLRGPARGGLADSRFVFAVVVDADHDKGRGGILTIKPSMTVETSPGNFHHWFLLTRPIAAQEAADLGAMIRVATGADGDSGVPTQPYRIAGTPNFPTKAKRARGRVAVEPTRIVEWTGRLWDPDELREAFAPQGSSCSGPIDFSIFGSNEPPPPHPDEAGLPAELMRDIRDGGVSRGLGAGGDRSRSGLFHAIVGELKKRGWTAGQIQALLERYPAGAAARYPKRLKQEIERSYAKVENGSNGVAAALAIVPSAGNGSTGGQAGASAASGYTLADAHRAFRFWLGPDYETDVIDTTLSAAAADRLGGDPLWVMVISGPGNAKTEEPV